MNDTLFLAWRYIIVNRGRIGLLVALVTLAAVLPLSLHLLLVELLGHLERQAHPVPALGAAHGTERDPGVGGSVLDAVVVLVAATSLLIMTVALALARGFRRAEMGILGRIGCSRARIWALLTLEMLFVVLASGVFVAVALGVVHGMSDELVRLMFPS